VVLFDQNHPNDASQILGDVECPGGIMAISKNDKHKEYSRYAAHCLKMVPAAGDQKSRTIQREMAAEWLKLADAVRRPSNPRK
jgi:hypothetical protein